MVNAEYSLTAEFCCVITVVFCTFDDTLDTFVLNFAKVLIPQRWTKHADRQTDRQTGAHTRLLREGRKTKVQSHP